MNFKRGFLNTPKAKEAVAADPRPVPSPKNPDPELLDTDNDSMDEEEVFTSPPVDLHQLPPHIRVALDAQGNNTTRYVFRSWPRDPNDQSLGELTAKHGKRAGNGIPIWGDNLYSFFRTRKFPQTPHVETFTSGSIMADRMREYGELDRAASEIAWVDREKSPRQVFPCDIGDIIQDIEENSFIPLPPPILQNRIPLHLLPKKLIVHAPKSLLAVDSLVSRTRSSEDFMSKDEPETTFTYSLSLSEEGRKKMEAGGNAAIKAEDRRKAEQDGLWREFMPSVEKSGPTDGRLILAKIPPRPSCPTSVEEAHLHVSYANKCGVGNHSVVYDVSWELPRRLLVQDVLCEACFSSAVEKEIERSKKAGEWELKPGEEQADITITKTVVETGDMVLSRYKPSSKKSKGKERADLSPPGFPKQKAKSPDAPDITEPPPPPGKGKGTEGPDPEHDLGGRSESPVHQESYMTPKLETRIHHSYKGPVICIYPEVEWQNEDSGPLCEHLSRKRRGAEISSTARVSVVAKLSKQHDPHLVQESTNYQAFPSHFSEHWTGYNILSPLHDPFPIGALVPQFYGYYVPDPEESEADTDIEVDSSSGSESISESYLSPILLLESCGVPVNDLQNLNMDDRQECLSLLLRFHHEDWWHGSFAGRNFLKQPGPLSEWPMFRRARNPAVTSFRLIDFGRSSKDHIGRIRDERGDAVRMLQLLDFSPREMRFFFENEYSDSFLPRVAR
jgi:hypothetical protein